MSLEHNRQVFRFDQETTEEVLPALEESLLALIREQVPTIQVIICSDYLKGVLTGDLLRETAVLARKYGIPLVTAPKATSPEKYRGASVLMPNLREFASLAGYRLSGNAREWMDEAAWSFLQEDMFTALLVTRGPDGMTLFERENGNLRRLDVSSLARGVYDVTGAGDTALCVFALAIAAGAKRSHAAHIANVAAGIVVGKRGTSCVTAEDILGKIHEENESRGSLQVSV
jgi:D-beta-D-heptose 7-phosphate kinase/D-beta-D-heptose 1-phosphate adenosyltransferase